MLDSYLNQQVSDKLNWLRRFLSQSKNLPKNAPSNLARIISPYFVCLWLSEWSLTFEKNLLEQHKVGGVFHFAHQTWKGESPQEAAIYFFSSANRTSRVITPWIYRVAYVSGSLYIESITPPGQDRDTQEGRTEQKLLMDESSGIDIELLDPNSGWSKVDQELKVQPFYYFCGFGFTDPRERSSFGFSISTTGKESDIFDESGRLTQTIQQQIALGFELNDFVKMHR